VSAATTALEQAGGLTTTGRPDAISATTVSPTSTSPTTIQATMAIPTTTQGNPSQANLGQLNPSQANPGQIDADQVANGQPASRSTATGSQKGGSDGGNSGSGSSSGGSGTPSGQPVIAYGALVDAPGGRPTTSTAGRGRGPEKAATTGISATGAAVGAAPATPLAATAATVAGGNADSPAQPMPLHQQLSAPIFELRARGDGTHSLLLELHPADLGQVSVEVRMRAGQLSISLGSLSEAARHSIATALPQLRSELAAAGLGGAAVSLDSGSANGQSARQHSASTERPTQHSGPAAASVTPTSTSVRESTTSPGVDRWL
jgi:flagellar hook-length control protein FliK